VAVSEGGNSRLESHILGAGRFPAGRLAEALLAA
jgi:hypothetical protein